MKNKKIYICEFFRNTGLQFIKCLDETIEGSSKKTYLAVFFYIGFTISETEIV